MTIAAPPTISGSVTASARSSITRACGSAIVRIASLRKLARRRRDSISRSSRSGRAQPTTRPGKPAPLPTSTTRPVPGRWGATPRAHSGVQSSGRGDAGPSTLRRPATARRRDQQDPAVVAGPLASCGDARVVLEREMHDASIAWAHRIHAHHTTGHLRLLSEAAGQLFEGFLPALSVALDVDDDAPATLAVTPDHAVDEVFERVERLAAPADHEPALLAGHSKQDRPRLGALMRGDRARDTEEAEDLLDKRPGPPRCAGNVRRFGCGRRCFPA